MILYFLTIYYIEGVYPPLVYIDLSLEDSVRVFSFHVSLFNIFQIIPRSWKTYSLGNYRLVS